MNVFIVINLDFQKFSLQNAINSLTIIHKPAEYKVTTF